MQKTLLFAIITAVTLSAVLPARAIDTGASMDEVMKELGPPQGRIAMGSMAIWTYAEGSVEFRNGRAAVVNLRPAKPAAPAVPAPAPVVAPPAPRPPAVFTPRPLPPGGKTVDVGNGVTLDLIWIEPGTFTMGSPPDEAGREQDEAQHQVTLTAGYWLGRYEVTQRLWEEIMGSNPSHFQAAGPDAPVEQVGWHDCQAFIGKLNERVPGGGFRLPTEAEWEYACRAGTTTVFSHGDDLDASRANFDGSAPYGAAPAGGFRGTTLTAGQFAPNARGLFDLHGNVWEWCQDWYGAYPPGAVTNPAGPASGHVRVLRGGCWRRSATNCRSAARVQGSLLNRDFDLGLRLARTAAAGAP